MALTTDYTEVLMFRKDWMDEGKCSDDQRKLALVDFLFYVLDHETHGTIVMRWREEGE